MKMKNIVAFFVMLVLVSCASIPTVAVVPTDTFLPSSPTHTPEPTLAITPLPTQTTTTQIGTPTTLSLKVKQSCVDLNPSSLARPNGTLVLQKDFGGPLYFLNLKTGSQNTVPDDSEEKVWRAYVSPNGKWIIYEMKPRDSFGEYLFILAGTNGDQEREMPYGDWDFTSIFWLNNSVLRVAEPNNEMTYINNYAFDPFTGTTTPLSSDFPSIAGGAANWGIDDNAIELGTKSGINLIYDPSLTKVVYPRTDGYSSLFDITANQEIARLSAPGRGRLPKWSPDGKQVAIIGAESDDNGTSDGFLITSHDGSQIKKILLPSSVSKKVHIEDYSWSPDGNQIALWLKTNESNLTDSQNPFELAVIDLKKNQIANYCIAGTSTIDQEGYIHKANIIWSPDNTQLLIVQYNKKNGTEEIIVDLEANTAYKVAENMLPIGWMLSEP